MRKIRLRVKLHKFRIIRFDRAFFKKFSVTLQGQNELIDLVALIACRKPQRRLKHLVTLNPRKIVGIKPLHTIGTADLQLWLNGDFLPQIYGEIDLKNLIAIHLPRHPAGF